MQKLRLASEENTTRPPGVLARRAESRRLLAELLTAHQPAIASSWAHKIHRHASLRPTDRWLETLFTSTSQGVSALITALATGSYSELQAYLEGLNAACLRVGYEIGEVSEALLMCKDAILPFISNAHATDSEGIVALISELDDCLRWMTGQFNTLYTAAMNRRLRDQQAQVTRMLRLSQANPDMLDIRDVLVSVAEGIIRSVEVDHCDFYLVDEAAGQLLPTPGISLIPQPPERVAAFLKHPLDLRERSFPRDVMERREPMVCTNAHGPAVDYHILIEEMGTQSVLGVPLVAYNRVLAIAVTGTFDERRTFTHEQIELAWEVAQAGTLVLENARLHEQVRQTVALEERERLAREIHDDLAQSLGLLRLQASHIEDLLRDGQTGQAVKWAGEMKQAAIEAHTDARDAIFSLRNSAATPADFTRMLEAQLERFRTLYGITVQLEVAQEALAALPTQALIQLTRIVQEALTNVRKHAHARTVQITVLQAEGRVVASLHDDGQGFDPAAVRVKANSGLGLQIMRERAESVGGSLHIESRPGQGSRMTVLLPYSERK